MLDNFDDLSEDELDTLITQTYIDRDMNIPAIAELCDTYPNKIRRIIQRLGYPTRSRSAAQKNALASGRHKHPTKGKGHSEAAKEKISESMSDVWENLSAKERQHRSKVAKDQWNAMSPEEKEELRRLAGDAVRKAAKEGSKLEKFLLEELGKAGYHMQFHREHVIKNERLHLDLVVPALGIVIEVDGPSHFLPIWGEETLARNQRADSQKDGLLLGSGFCVIRVQQRKALSIKYKKEILGKVLTTIQQLEKKKPTTLEKRYIVIGE